MQATRFNGRCSRNQEQARPTRVNTYTNRELPRCRWRERRRRPGIPFRDVAAWDVDSGEGWSLSRRLEKRWKVDAFSIAKHQEAVKIAHRTVERA